MPKIFEKKLRQARIRCGINRFLEIFAFTALLFGILGVLAILAEKLLALPIFTEPFVVGLTERGRWIIYSAVAVGLIIIFTIWVVKFPKKMAIALDIDQKMDLKERFSSTISFYKQTQQNNPFVQAFKEQTMKMVGDLKVSEHFPIRFSRKWMHAIGVWIIAGVLVATLPQKDLLGVFNEEKEEKKRKEVATQAKKDIETVTKPVEAALDKLGEGEMADALADLKRLENASGTAAKRQAIKKLGEISDAIKNKQSEKSLESVKMMQAMLKQIKPTADVSSQKLSQQLAKGEFAKANETLRQMQKQLQNENMSPQQQKELQKQMSDLAKQLKKLAQRDKKLEEELEKAGMKKKLAQRTKEQVRKELEEAGLDKKKIEELMKKLAASNMAKESLAKMANAMASMGEGKNGLTGEELSELMNQLDELESLKDQIKLSQAVMDEIARASEAMGQGMGNMPGQGKGDGAGPGGIGRGYGERESDTSGQVATKNTKLENESKDGPAVASWYFKGQQVKGKAQLGYSEAVQAGRDNAAEAISDNKVPRRYEQTVKNYFGNLEKQQPKDSE
ncbi:MAG: hypothetical protein JEZ07_05190 [Phycisphaerae bacterium]|nr:hypothetical protein [Phycisphaerae bacterium]